MEETNLTYWKNYQTAMQWISGNPRENIVETTKNEVEGENEEELEFMIDDHLLNFYRLSKEHKINRKNQRSQEKTEAESVELIPGEQMRPNTQSISKLPPINRSKMRQLELEWLYGSTNASKIHARETQLQMEFDQMFDKKQPSYFPSLPNRLQLKPLAHEQRSTIPTVPIVDMTL